MRRWMVWAAAAALAGCLGAPAAAPELAPATEITLKEACGGYITVCPGYRISMTPDGHYRYQGEKDAQPAGAHEGILRPDAWAKAEAAFKSAKWSELPEQFAADKPPCMPDSPVAVFTRKDAKGEKQVVYNLGCASKAGDALLSALRVAMPKPEAEPPQKQAASQLIRFYQSPCYFRCATYTIELHPDGSYILTWPQPEPAKAPVTGKLAADAWGRATAAFDAAGFAGMPERIGQAPGGAPCINDLPAVEFTRRGADGVEKTVNWNTGCANVAAGKLSSDLRDILKDVPIPKGG